MKQVFINLAVKDVEKSLDFYTQLGFSVNPQFSDEQTKCMVWSETIFVMISSHEKFKTFIIRPISDTKNSVASWFALSVGSLETLNEFVENGLKAGGTEPTPIKDYGFMQLRNLEDLDGYTWEIFFMDTTKIPNQD
ncbi:VOC family protein [Pedobacter heparinus]|uniref:Glyoxalase/bleomycin resistance protein/dioxygenase n=1 Tax=Pedobacter heparinus (strain ATCC 13125 / DSM 2366 / CIP 104194 / JCM 7457 / NBRC 12017 / NCIMB 9290 / NRRL B-14731 / HIM 762-3) TaxID=485917 RepID=C6XVC3_PEDHD|nr:VOC family protein [Pedobacter heparinus]ACU03989.1 Glyoxalase/bleomycin resistance protein/dioxygenase [Pedobacter heparinus DSM 2366]